MKKFHLFFFAVVLAGCNNSRIVPLNTPDYILDRQVTFGQADDIERKFGSRLCEEGTAEKVGIAVHTEWHTKMYRRFSDAEIPMYVVYSGSSGDTVTNVVYH